MFLHGNKIFIKIIPVFLCLHFSLVAQKVIMDDLVKGKWYVEGNLNDSTVKLARKRNLAAPFRTYTFVQAGVIQRCDSVYQSDFDANGNERQINKLDCNSPATFGIKNMVLMVSTGQATFYFIIDPKKGGGYILKRTKSDYYYQN
jgi:hypothetical protein